MAVKPTAVIEGWVLISSPIGSVLVGHIRDHERQEDFKGPLQATSLVLTLDLAKGVAETENTIYLLGRDATGSVPASEAGS